MRRSTTLTRVVTYAGIDYHKKFSVVTLGDPEGNVISSAKLYNDRGVIRDFFSQYPGLQCTVESCRGYEWFVDLLKELGLTVHICNPYKVRLIAETRSKSDRVDSRILMQLLAMGYLPTCYQATPEERALRERLRWRDHLVRHSTRIKQRIQVMIDKENLGHLQTDLFTKKGRQFLEQVQLSSQTRQQLLREHIVILDDLQAKIAREDSWVTRMAKKMPNAQLLKTIPGIGDLSALVILAELGDVHRFKRAAQVVSFAGLCPSTFRTANTSWNGRLTKQGSSMLRWILVQDAWKAVGSAEEFKSYFARRSFRLGKQTAIITVARKILEISFHVLKNQTPYDSQIVATGSAPRSA